MRPRRKTVIDSDLFVSHHCDKAMLGDFLGCNRDTIRRWENLAFWRVPQFRDSYPKAATGERDRTHPLNEYQCWVISRIARLMSHLKRSERVKTYIAQHPQEFSRYTYQKSLKALQQTA